MRGGVLRDKAARKSRRIDEYRQDGHRHNASQNARHHQQLERIDGENFDRVNLFVHPHARQLRRYSSAHSSSHQQTDYQRANIRKK